MAGRFALRGGTGRSQTPLRDGKRVGAEADDAEAIARRLLRSLAQPMPRAGLKQVAICQVAICRCRRAASRQTEYIRP